ncbi:MAG: ABC transporter permease [Acetobacteraceae bacterium]|nr:ABC transporter permease [Acetobacteraceae bacterium]
MSGIGRLLWALFAGATALFLVAPLLVVVPLSFSSASFLEFPPPGLSFRWYEALWQSPFWRLAALNTLLIGTASTAIATALGTLAAIGLWLAPLPGRPVLFGLILSPMIVPVIITAVALTFAFAPIGLAASHWGLILAHAALGAPFVVVTVLATLSGFDRTLLRAAAACGAGPVAAFRRVMLPLLLPGVVSGAVFAFATSLDETVVVLFLGGPEQRTLPRQMFAGLKDTIELTILAAATVLIAASTLLLIAARLLAARSARLASGPRR